jgi:hypothetical protein
MEAPKCPNCQRKALYTIYGDGPTLRCKKCQQEFKVFLVPVKWWPHLVETLKEAGFKWGVAPPGIATQSSCKKEV